MKRYIDLTHEERKAYHRRWYAEHREQWREYRKSKKVRMLSGRVYKRPNQ